MGICGSAMGALAAMLQARGYEVRGSDSHPYPPMSDALAALGIPIARGYEAANLEWTPDAVVVGNVIRPTYPEAVALRARGIPHASLPQALAALFLADKTRVIVTGTHGKTTTASMTAWLLETAGLAPSFFIGGVTGNWGTNYRLGAGQPFVVEGDEYDTAYFDKGAKFFHYAPQLASINNLEFDHADIFPDVAAIESTFARFAALLPPDGQLFVPAWEPRALAAARATSATFVTTALDAPGDIRATDLLTAATGSTFTLHLRDAPPVRTTLPHAGRHNVANALMAAGLAHAAGAPPEAIARGLATFQLPFKRLTLRGEALGIPVIDDFAHHPTAIAATLTAIRQQYPGRRLVALFEAQSNTARRRVFQSAFADALAHADRVWFCRVLDKASDPLPADQRLDLAELCADLTARGTPAAVIPDALALAHEVAADACPHADVVVAMSGRNFEGVHGHLLAALAARA